MDLMKLGEWFSKGEGLVNRLSYQDTSKYFRWGLFVSFVMLLLNYPGVWVLPDSLQNFFAYLLAMTVALGFGYIVWDAYIKDFFRNLIGVICFSVWLPNRVHLILMALLTGNLRTEAILVVIGFFLPMIIFWIGRKDWKFHKAIIEQCGFRTWIKLPLYYVVQNKKLQKKQKHWKKWNELKIEDLCSGRWWKLSKKERSELIRRIAQYEAEILGLNADFSLLVYSSWGGIAADPECEIDIVGHCIIWDEDTVELFLPHHILEEMIASMQLYKWYETLPENDQEALRRACVSADTLLLQQLKSSEYGEAYDILNRLYAKARSDWYCG